MKNGAPIPIEERQTIGHVPILTVDGYEIKLGMLVYTNRIEGGYSHKGKFEARIIPHRVISVNQTTRYIRIRCKNGCEESVSYSEGCGIKKLYGDTWHANKEIEAALKKDIEKVAKKLKEVRSCYFKLSKIRSKGCRQFYPKKNTIPPVLKFTKNKVRSK